VKRSGPIGLLRHEEKNGEEIEKKKTRKDKRCEERK
jgi:hypothetical protein